jgi:hypothetical protein
MGIIGFLIDLAFSFLGGRFLASFSSERARQLGLDKNGFAVTKR